MDLIVNTHQAEAWNGYEGRHWAENADRYDAVNGGINDHLFAAAAVGERDRVLDVGCGTGQTTRLAARQAWRGHVVGIDLSAPMLTRARATATEERITNVLFEQGDAQVHPFAEGGFDVAISRAAIMFFADPVAAFANIGHALRPGGRLVFVCLQDMASNEQMARMFAPLRPFIRDNDAAGDATPGPGSLADPARIDQVLLGAGFHDITVKPVTVPMVFGRDVDDAAAFFIGWGPVRYWLRNADEATVSGVRANIATAIRPFAESDAVRISSACWLVSATWPGPVPR